MINRDDGNNKRKIPKLAIFAALAILIIAVAGTVVAVSGFVPGNAPPATPATDRQNEADAPASVLPAVSLENSTIAYIPVAPEELESATLQLTGPNSSSLTPYTQRGFGRATIASIAWWKEPGFYDNTTEYRNYLRSTPERQASYTEARRIFFDFATANMDPAIEASTLQEELILFRGVSPRIAQSVLMNGTYIELAYPSTTYDVTISLVLFGARGSDGYKNALVMQRDTGEKALYVDEEEREFILPRNTTWNVIKAVNVENLTIEADFPLMSNNNTTDTVSKVRLIYIKEVV